MDMAPLKRGPSLLFGPSLKFRLPLPVKPQQHRRVFAVNQGRQGLDLLVALFLAGLQLAEGEDPAVPVSHHNLGADRDKVVPQKVPVKPDNIRVGEKLAGVPAKKKVLAVTDPAVQQRGGGGKLPQHGPVRPVGLGAGDPLLDLAAVQIPEQAEQKGENQAGDAQERYGKNQRDGQHGQGKEDFPTETLTYLTSAAMEQVKVDNWDETAPAAIYDVAALEGDSPYDVFLSGPTPLVTLENPNATSDKELVIFRDSYSCSLAPLLVEQYKTVTLVDLRYMMSSFLPQYVDFAGKDVLFLYNEQVVNHSEMLK